jgi:hypothetical protein
MANRGYVDGVWTTTQPRGTKKKKNKREKDEEH